MCRLLAGYAPAIEEAIRRLMVRHARQHGDIGHPLLLLMIELCLDGLKHGLELDHLVIKVVRHRSILLKLKVIENYS